MSIWDAHKEKDRLDKSSEEIMSAKEFIYIYNSSTTLDEVIEKTGLDLDAVTQRADDFRSKHNINMRIFPKPVPKKDEWAELASFAQSVLDETESEEPRIIRSKADYRRFDGLGSLFEYSNEDADDDEIDVGSHIGLTLDDEEVFGVIVEFDDDENLVTIEEDGTGDLVTGYQDDMFLKD
jgi:hypothetical protein